MSETETEIATTAEAEAGEKKEPTPEEKAHRIALRAIARALARVDGTQSEMKTRWTEGRKDYTAKARKLSKALIREGVSMTVEPRTPKAKGEATDDAVDGADTDA